MRDGLLEEIRRACANATGGPWYTVEKPWRASYFDEETGQHRDLPTYIVAGDPDPQKASAAIVDSPDVDIRQQLRAAIAKAEGREMPAEEGHSGA